MTQLSAGDPLFRSDRGGADAAVVSALAEYSNGTGTEQAVLTALAGARLLVPVVAVVADDGQDALRPVAEGAKAPAAGPRGEKASEMGTPAIVGRDGRMALPAFTSLETLRRWQADARPVPVAALGVWQSAVQESQAVIIDIAGPVPLAIEGARLAALASGAPVPALHEDPDVRAAVGQAAAAQPPGVRIRLGPPHDDADFTLELAPADLEAGPPVSADLARAFAETVASRLPGRIRRGIALIVHAPAGGTERTRGPQD